MKKSILNLRLDESIKQALEEKCLSKEIRISQGAREAIQQYVENVDELDVNGSETNYSTGEIDDDEPYYNEKFNLLKSWLFTRFLYWIMIKQQDPLIRLDYDLCKRYMKLANEISDNSFFTDEIKVEFLKVYKELYEYLYGNTHDRYQFRFAQYGGFDYSKLYAFMQDVNFNEEGMKTIYLD